MNSQRPLQPTVFRFRIESWLRYPVRVEWNAGKFTVEASGEIRTIPHVSWRQLRDACDFADIWSWQAEYDDPLVFHHATSWELAVTYPDRTAFSRGYGCTPAFDSPSNYAYHWGRLGLWMAAVSQALSSRFFLDLMVPLRPGERDA